MPPEFTFNQTSRCRRANLRCCLGGFPEVENVVEGDEGVGAIGEDPQRRPATAAGRNELAVIESTPASHGDADAATLQRSQLMELIGGHGRMTLPPTDLIPLTRHCNKRQPTSGARGAGPDGS